MAQKGIPVLATQQRTLVVHQGPLYPNRGHYYLAGDLSSLKGTPVSQSEILMVQRRVLGADKWSLLPDWRSLQKVYGLLKGAL